MFMQKRQISDFRSCVADYPERSSQLDRRYHTPKQMLRFRPKDSSKAHRVSWQLGRGLAT